MEKIFREYLARQFERCLREVAPEFRLSKISARATSPGALFEWVPAPETRFFIDLQFVKNRDYVQLNCQWSTLGRLPSEELNDEIHDWMQRSGIALTGSKSDLKRLAENFPEGWLRLVDLGKAVGKFEMNEPVPPLDRLEAAFSTPDGAALLQEAGIEDWRTSPLAEPYLSWVIVGGLMALTEEDARHAVDGTAVQMCRFARDHHLPILRAIAEVLAAGTHK